jgi:hypothetical protein
MMTSALPLTGGPHSAGHPSTSSAEGFPANPSLPLDSSAESLTSDGDGHGCSRSSPLFALDTSSSKTSRRCLGTLKLFRSSSATYPTSGSMSNGQLYQRAPWVPHTDDADCSLFIWTVGAYKIASSLGWGSI